MYSISHSAREGKRSVNKRIPYFRFRNFFRIFDFLSVALLPIPFSVEFQQGNSGSNLWILNNSIILTIIMIMCILLHVFQSLNDLYSILRCVRTKETTKFSVAILRPITAIRIVSLAKLEERIKSAKLNNVKVKLFINSRICCRLVSVPFLSYSRR